MTDYIYDQIVAVDKSNPSIVPTGGFVTIFAPGDTTQTPIPLTTLTGLPMANPVPINSLGMGPGFISQLWQVAWAGGDLTGTWTSNQGLRDEAVAAQAAAETAQAAAESAASGAADAAAASLASAVAEAEAAAQSAADAAALVGAPADDAMAATINNGASSTRGALNATYAGVNLPKHATTDNVLYVSKSGNDANDGRAPGNAKLTIMAAVNTLATGGLHGEVRVGAGEYVEVVTLYDAVSIIGAGSNMTTIKPPSGSTAAGAVILAPGPVTAMKFQGFKIVGNGNAGQHGIYAASSARPAPAYGDGGWWYSRIKDITITGFTGRGIWLRGGGATYMLPHQFLVFEMVRVFMAATANKEALVLSGQVGQIDFLQCEFDTDDVPPYGSTMTVPNIYLAPQLNDNGTFADDTNAYAITFHTPTIQGGWKAVYATHPCSGVEFINPHLEGFKYGFHADSGAILNLRGGGLDNVGNGDGTGYWSNSTIGGSIIWDSPRGGGTRDKTFISDSNAGSATRIANASKSLLGSETVNVTKEFSVGTGTLALQGNRSVICNTSATPITAITSAAAPGESVFIQAFGGPLTFTTGSGLQLGGKTSVTVPQKTIVQFTRIDLLNVWAMVGLVTVPGAWAAPVLINSWANVGGVYSNAGYRLTADGAHVELEGQITGGAASSVAFVLPLGFRPTATKVLGMYSVGNGGGRGLQIGTDGNVTVMNGVTGPVSLDGVTFPIDG